jgi:hypothetical protein
MLGLVGFLLRFSLRDPAMAFPINVEESSRYAMREGAPEVGAYKRRLKNVALGWVPTVGSRT